MKVEGGGVGDFSRVPWETEIQPHVSKVQAETAWLPDKSRRFRPSYPECELGTDPSSVSVYAQ